jgi:hypothetical protein
MPLGLPGDLIVPIEFEPTYQEICSGYRII